MGKKKAIQRIQFAIRKDEMIEKLIREMERPDKEEIQWLESKSRIYRYFFNLRITNPITPIKRMIIKMISQAGKALR